MNLHATFHAALSSRANAKLKTRLRIDIKKRQVYILAFVYKSGPTLLMPLAAVMKRNKRTIDPNVLKGLLIDLQSKGLTTRDDRRRWSITFLGIDLLHRYEKQLRKERHDR
jgi:hypothetical protein